jgi:hypothetical protein
MFTLLQNMRIDASEATFTTVIFGILIWLSVMMNNLYAENLRQRYRIIHLSDNLQIAEYNTGKPYYTRISLPALEYESPILELYKRNESTKGGRGRSVSI